MSPTMVGAAWMISGGIGWTAMSLLVRELSADYSAFELLFFRNLVALCILLPLALRSGVASLKTRRLPLHALRAVLSCIAVLGLFYGIGHLPLPDVTALSFTQPVFVVVLAALILKETVNRARWLAVILGFAGLLVVVRPGFAEIGIATLAVIGSSISYACSNMCTKRLLSTDTPNQSIFYFNLLMLPLALVPTLFFWVTPTPRDFLLMIAIGVCGTVAVYGYVRAFAAADASAVVPFDFLRMPVAALAAYVLFAETGDFWTWIGSAIIFTGAYLLVRIERQGKGS